MTTMPIRVFYDHDPRQHAFRVKVAKLNDSAIVELENDLESYARTGLITKYLSRFIETEPA